MVSSAAGACVLFALLSVSVGAAVRPSGFAPLRSGRGSAMRLISKTENDGDNTGNDHNDPDAYVPQGDDKKSEERVLSCTQFKNLYLRGGAGLEEAITPSEGEKLQIVFVSAEIAPWSITGGLGAVSPPLPHGTPFRPRLPVHRPCGAAWLHPAIVQRRNSSCASPQLLPGDAPQSLAGGCAYLMPLGSPEPQPMPCTSTAARVR